MAAVFPDTRQPHRHRLKSFAALALPHRARPLEAGPRHQQTQFRPRECRGGTAHLPAHPEAGSGGIARGFHQQAVVASRETHGGLQEAKYRAPEGSPPRAHRNTKRLRTVERDANIFYFRHRLQVLHRFPQHALQLNRFLALIFFFP